MALRFEILVPVDKVEVGGCRLGSQLLGGVWHELLGLVKPLVDGCTQPRL